MAGEPERAAPRPPVIPAKALRPGRFWYGVAALIVLCGVLAAIGMVQFVTRYGGDLGQPLRPGQPVTVRLSPSASKVVWVKETGERLPDIECDQSPMDGQKNRNGMTYFLGSHTVEHRVDGERWRGLVAIYAEPAGRYALTCRTSGTGGTPTLSIGDPPRFYEPKAAVFLDSIAFGVASLGAAMGLLLAVIVMGLRSLHRNRLTRQLPGTSPG